MNKRADDQYGNMRFTGHFFWVGVLICLSLIVVIFLYTRQNKYIMPKQPVIEVSFAGNHCLLVGENFELKWIHSVEKQWWIEAYQLKDDQLFLSDTYFQTFGAGTPATQISRAYAANGLKETTHQQARKTALDKQYKGYVHYHVNTTLPYLNWMISSNIQATIVNQGRALPIYQWVDDYTNIYIAPTMMSPWMQMFQEPCHEYHSTR